MNEIYVRTNKEDYVSGEIIYGAVYLSIRSPTSGCSVHLRCKGYEFFEFRNTSENKNKEDVLTGKKEYINCDVKIYEAEGQKVLPRGQYVFPFQTPLPVDMPAGEFVMNKSCWKACIKYSLVAYIQGEDKFKCEQNLLIHERHSSGSIPEPVTTKLSVTRFFFSRHVTATAVFDKVCYNVGDTAKLSLDIENTTSKTLNSITIKLLRDLSLSGKWRSTATSMGDSSSSSHSVQEQEQHYKHDRRNHKRVTVKPENGDSQQPVTIWGKVLPANAQVQLELLKNILVPLHYEDDDTDLPPSVTGSHIQCNYYVNVEVHVDKKTSLYLDIPVKQVKPKCNQEWKKWIPPPWLYHCELKLGSHQCSVAEHLLDSEPYAGMPGFQKL